MNPRPFHSFFIFGAAAASLTWCVLASMALGQINSLEDRPYQPSASVVKGTLAALSDPSEEVVVLAVRALGDWRQASAAPEVAKMLTTETPEAVRMEAFHFLARLGPQAKPHIAAVLKYVSDPNPNIRAAALAVVFQAEASAANIDAIRPLLDDSRSDVSASAANCLGQAAKAAGPHRNALLKALGTTSSTEFKAAALRALYEIGGLTGADLDAIIPLNRSHDPEVRIAAWATTLSGLIGAKAAGTIDDEKVKTVRALLVARFHREPPEIKAQMIEDAGKNKATAEASVAELLNQIRTGTPETKAAALRVLGKAGEAALDQVALIVAQGKDPDFTVRAATVAALGSLGSAAVKPNLEMVANALRDPSELVRDEALQALPAAGDALRNFPYKIRDVFPDADASIRGTLLKALPIIVNGRGIDDELIASGRAALKDADPDVRSAAAFVIGQLSVANGVAFLPGLLDLTKDSDPDVRGSATISLRAYATDGAARQTIRNTIRPLLKDRDADVRWAALDTLHEVEPAQDPAIVAEIAALLKDEEQSVRSAAVRALGAGGAAARTHFLDIVRFFNDDPAAPPYAAAQAVAEISPLTPQELTSLFYPAYVYSDLLPLTRLTAYGASGGEPDGVLVVRLLGRSRSATNEVVTKADKARAFALLQDALKAPLLHEKLKAEINTRLTEVNAIP